MPTTTPNMSLIKPVPSVDTGPGWATNLNASLDLLDSHDHSPGKGVKVTQAGLNITSDLTLNSHSLLSALSVSFATGTLGGTANGGFFHDGTDVHWKDGSGTDIKVTANGRVGPCLAGDYGQTGITAQFRYTNSTALYELFADAGATYANVKALAATFNGSVTIADGQSIVAGSSTGMKVGTASTQKLGFFGVAPVAQPTASSDVTVATAGVATAVLRDTTFTGGSGSAYTIGGIVQRLKQLGILG